MGNQATQKQPIDPNTIHAKTRCTVLDKTQVAVTVYDATRAHVTNVAKKFYSAIGHIHITFLEKVKSKTGDLIEVESESMGTGTLIGDDIVITAAHNVDFPHGVTKAVTFSPGARAEKEGPFGTIIVDRWQLHPEWRRDLYGTQNNHESDIALLFLAEPIGKKSGFVSYKSLSNEELDGIIVTIAGYPADFKEKEKLMKEAAEAIKDPEVELNFIPFLMQMSGKIIKISDKILNYKIKTSFGQSGSGLITFSPSFGYMIVGIHSSKSRGDMNNGVRITPFIEAWIENEEKMSKMLVSLNINYQNLNSEEGQTLNLMNEIKEVNEKIKQNNPVHTKLQILYTISHGAQGIVYRVYDPNYNKFYALKVIDLIGNEQNEKLAIKEIKIMLRMARYQLKLSNFDENAFLNLYEIKYMKGEYCTFLMELGIGTLASLYQFKKSEGQSFSKKEIKLIAREILISAYYLRKKKIYHRDIKPNNIVITPKLRAKFADFGISEMLEKDQIETGTFLVAGTEGFWPAKVKEAFDQKMDSVEMDLWLGEQETIINNLRFLSENQINEGELKLMVSNLLKLIEKERMPRLLISLADKESLEKYKAFEITKMLKKSDTENRIDITRSLLNSYSTDESKSWFDIIKSQFLKSKDNYDYLLIEGDIEYNLLHYRQAIELFKEFLSKKSDNVTDLEEIKVYEKISGCYKILNEFDLALEFAQESVDKKIRLLGDKSHELCKSYHLVADIHSEMANFPKTLEYLNMISKIIKTKTTKKTLT